MHLVVCRREGQNVCKSFTVQTIKQADMGSNNRPYDAKDIQISKALDKVGSTFQKPGCPFHCNFQKMTRGTPEVGSGKSLTLLTFDQWTNGQKDQWTNGPWTHGPMDQ